MMDVNKYLGIPKDNTHTQIMAQCCVFIRLMLTHHILSQITLDLFIALVQLCFCRPACVKNLPHATSCFNEKSINTQEITVLVQPFIAYLKM